MVRYLINGLMPINPSQNLLILQSLWQLKSTNTHPATYFGFLCVQHEASKHFRNLRQKPNRKYCHLTSCNRLCTGRGVPRHLLSNEFRTYLSCVTGVFLVAFLLNYFTFPSGQLAWHRDASLTYICHNHQVLKMVPPTK